MWRILNKLSRNLHSDIFMTNWSSQTLFKDLQKDLLILAARTSLDISGLGVGGTLLSISLLGHHGLEVSISTHGVLEAGLKMKWARNSMSTFANQQKQNEQRLINTRSSPLRGRYQRHQGSYLCWKSWKILVSKKFPAKTEHWFDKRTSARNALSRSTSWR